MIGKDEKVQLNYSVFVNNQINPEMSRDVWMFAKNTSDFTTILAFNFQDITGHEYKQTNRVDKDAYNHGPPTSLKQI